MELIMLRKGRIKLNLEDVIQSVMTIDTYTVSNYCYSDLIITNCKCNIRIFLCLLVGLLRLKMLVRKPDASFSRMLQHPYYLQFFCCLYALGPI